MTANAGTASTQYISAVYELVGWAPFKVTVKKAPEEPEFLSQVTVKGFLGTSGDNKRFSRFPQVTIKDF